MGKRNFALTIMSIAIVLSLGVLLSANKEAKAQTIDMGSTTTSVDTQSNMGNMNMGNMGNQMMGSNYTNGFFGNRGYFNNFRGNSCGCGCGYTPVYGCNNCQIPCGVNLLGGNAFNNVLSGVTNFLINDTTRNVLNSIIGNTYTSCPMCPSLGL